MKLKQRLLSYCILLAILFTSPLIYNSIVQHFNGDQGDPMFFGILSLLIILNIVYSFFTFKSQTWKKIIAGVIVFAISFTVSVSLVRMNLKFESDWLGVWTLVISNSVFPIVCWEIIYQIERKRQVRNETSSTANSGLAK